MKGIFLLAIISLMFVNIAAQNRLTDREFDGLKGKVKSVAIFYSTVENKDGNFAEKPSGIRFKKYYDENGNISQTLNYIVGDKNIYFTIDGDKVFKTEKIEGVGGSGISGTSNRESKPKPRDERYSIKFKFKFDDKNRIIEESLYSNDNELISKTVYKYDEKGRVKESERYNTYKSDKLTSRAILKYDNNNNLLEETFILMVNNGSESRNTYSNYKFDAQGNWIERTKTINYKREGKNSVSKHIDRQKIDYYEN